MRYYILLYSLLLGLTVILYFWFDAATEEGEEYEKWFLALMINSAFLIILCYYFSKKVQKSYQLDYKYYFCREKRHSISLVVKAPAAFSLRSIFILSDLLHISVSLWGMIIYWDNYTFI